MDQRSAGSGQPTVSSGGSFATLTSCVSCFTHYARRPFSLAVLALGVLALSACGTAPAARVNGEVITRAEYQHNVREIMDFLAITEGINWSADPAARAELPRLRGAVLENIIDTRLIRQQAKQDGIVVGEREVDARAAELIEVSGGRDEFLARLQMRGFTALAFRQYLQDELLRERLAERHAAVTLEPVELRHIRHVLVASADEAVAARQRLANGESWEAVAGAVSQDPGTRTRGGELGFIQRGDTVPEFDEAAFALDINELSQPVVSPFGYHILQVTEAQTQPPTAAQVQRQQQQAFEQYLSMLRQNADIQHHVTEALAPSAPAQP